MKTNCKEGKKLLYILCLFESWISYYHKERKIHYVVLINLIFLLILDIVLTSLTFIISMFFNNMLLIPFGWVFLFYLFIMIIITFQNLFDTNFNISSKIKILILSVFSGLSLKKCTINLAFYVFSWIILLVFLSYSIDNYMKNAGIKNINDNILISLIMLSLFIIIFIIYVYGINDPYIKCKRKLLLYGISTIVASVSTINSIEGMYKNNINYVDVFNFQFIVLLFALILSVDRVMGNFTTLFKEYNDSGLAINSEMCENCIILSITFPVVRDKIKSYVINFFVEVKKVFVIYKAFNFRKKLLVVPYFIFSLVFSIAFVIFVFKLGDLLDSKSGIIMFKFTNAIRNMFYSFNELVGYEVSNILWMILVVIGKIFLVVLTIIALIFCLIYIGDNGMSIIGILKESFHKKSLDFFRIQKYLRNLSISITILGFIIIMPFALLDKRGIIPIGIILEIIILIGLLISILYVICITCNRIYNMVEKYKNK